MDACSIDEMVFGLACSKNDENVNAFSKYKRRVSCCNIMKVLLHMCLEHDVLRLREDGFFQRALPPPMVDDESEHIDNPESSTAHRCCEIFSPKQSVTSSK
jgi:hypothetical protein